MAPFFLPRLGADCVNRFLGFYRILKSPFERGTIQNGRIQIFHLQHILIDLGEADFAALHPCFNHEAGLVEHARIIGGWDA